MATATIACCSVTCTLCCCLCEQLCSCGPSFEDLVKTPPTATEVKNFIEAILPKADPNGEPDVICCCLPKSLVCCLPRLCCPCVCHKPDPVVTVKTRDVLLTVTNNTNSKSFLSDKRCMKYAAKLFQSRDADECRLEFLSAGMVLLAVGSIQEKLESLFEAFQFAVGGVFNRAALERTLRSLMKTVVDISKKVANYVSGAVALPGGKAVGLMLTTLHGTVGTYFVQNRVNKMLQRDVNDDGKIDFDEFQLAAMRRDSLIRKAIAWVERKTAIIRGERSDVLVGQIKVDGKLVWARILEVDLEKDECLEYWETEEQVGQRGSRLGRISLREPCAIDDGEDESDNAFTIIDSDKKKWEIECLDKDSFFDWYDSVDEMCDARLEANDLTPADGDDAFGACPPAFARMLR